MADISGDIHPEMTVLEVVSRHRQTESVFRAYDAMAGACICCQALFESLKDVSDTYDLDLDQLMADLQAVTEPQSTD